MIMWFQLMAFLVAAQFTLFMGRVVNNETSIWWGVFPIFCYCLSMAAMRGQIEKKAIEEFKKAEKND